MIRRSTASAVALLTVLLILLLNVLPTTLAQDETPTIQEKFGPLLNLAQYVPYDAPVYASVRADDDYVAALDDLIGDVTASLPTEMAGPLTRASLRDALDLLATQFGRNFDTVFRSWLGDSMAAAVYSFDALFDDDWRNDSEFGFAILLEVTNRDAATEFARQFIEQSYPFESFTEQTEADYTLFAPVEGGFLNVALMVRDDVAVLATTPDILPYFGASGSSLAQNPLFTETLNALPADTYNVAAYVDVPTVLSYSLGSTYYRDQNQRLLATALLRATGPVALGGTLTEPRTLVLDGVVAAGESAGFDSLGMTLGQGVQIDPAFLDRLPADSALAIHGTQPLGFYPLVAQNLSGLTNFVLGLSPDDPTGQELADSANTAVGRYVDAFFANLTGLRAEQYANWLSSDYLFFMRPEPLDPALSLFETRLRPPVDFGVVFRALDPAMSREAMTTLARNLPLTLRGLGARSTGYRTEVNNGVTTLVMTIYSSSFGSDERVSVDLLFAADDTAFVFGTRRAVIDVIAPGVGSESPAFAPGRALNPGTASMAWYFNGRELPALVDRIAVDNFDFVRNRALYKTIAYLLGDGTAYLLVNENGDTVVRLTLTLSDAEQTRSFAEEALNEQPITFATVTPFPSPTAFPTLPPLPTLVPTWTPFPTTTPTPNFTATPFPTLPPGATAIPLPDDLGALDLSSLPSFRADDGAFVLGEEDAPVTIVLFTDPACPPCERYLATALQFIEDFVTTGQANFELRLFPTAGGEATARAARAAECADEQREGAYWDAFPYLFELAQTDRTTYDADAAGALARQFDLDAAELEACAEGNGLQVETDIDYAREIGIGGTPSLRVRFDGGDAEVIEVDGQAYESGGAPYEVLAALVEGESQQRSSDATPIPSDVEVPTTLSDANFVGALALDALQQGTITGDTDDLWSFEGEAGQSIVINLVALQDTLDPRVSLYTADGDFLAENDDIDLAGGDYNSRIEITLDDDGTYFVLVDPYDGTGKYELTVREG